MWNSTSRFCGGGRLDVAGVSPNIHGVANGKTMLAGRGPAGSAGCAGSWKSWFWITHVASAPRLSANTGLAVSAVLSVVDTSTEICSQPFAAIAVFGVLLSARSLIAVSARGPCHGNSAAS